MFCLIAQRIPLSAYDFQVMSSTHSRAKYLSNDLNVFCLPLIMNLNRHFINLVIQFVKNCVKTEFCQYRDNITLESSLAWVARAICKMKWVFHECF